MNYIAIIHKEAGSDFGVSFPDFPGCITAGTTVDEAKDMAIEALQGHVDVMKEAGLKIPAPSSLEAIMQDPDFQNGVAFLVSLKEEVKTVRVNITMSESELAAIDRIAKEQGATRSGWMVKASLQG